MLRRYHTTAWPELSTATVPSALNSRVKSKYGFGIQAAIVIVFPLRTPMHRHVVLAVLLASGPVAAWSAPQRPQNVLFLLSDDQRADTIRALGNAAIETPSLDRLVREGFAFDRAYCMGSQSGAVCIPSRAMILTGRTLFRCEERDAHLWPEAMRRAGFATFVTGKWHNARDWVVRSFASGESIFFGGMGNHTALRVQDLADGRFGEPRGIGGFSSTAFADAAIGFLERRGRDDPPFFLWVSFTAPHDPRTPPDDHRARYDPAKLPLPANFLPQLPFDNGEMVVRDERLAPWPRTEETSGSTSPTTTA
jgi:arylsulfatase A-like enzyme